jgi:hypothetical protein
MGAKLLSPNGAKASAKRVEKGLAGADGDPTIEGQLRLNENLEDNRFVHTGSRRRILA